MSKITVGLYRGYDADRRLSMEIYCNALAAALDAHEEISVSTIHPRSWLERFAGWGMFGKLVMRFLRYVSFPRLVGRTDVELHHVIDHGYAHLATRFTNRPSVVTVHDLIPLLNWKGLIAESGSSPSSKIRKPRLNLYSLSHLHSFDQIVADSNSTATDLTQYLGIDRKKIEVIPVIIADYFKILRSKQIEQFAAQHQLDTSFSWVMISGQEFYKNHDTSLRVLKRLDQLSNGRIRFVKTGVATDHFNELLERYAVEHLVHQLYFDQVTDLSNVYNFVDCLLFPSLYEGFGMPVLESLACGTPVVASNRGSLRELEGEFISHFDAFDVESLSQAVFHHILNPRPPIQVAQASSLLLQQCSQEAVAEKWKTIYARLLTTQTSSI